MPSFNCHPGLRLPARQAMQRQPFPASAETAVSCPHALRSLKILRRAQARKATSHYIQDAAKALMTFLLEETSVGNTPRKAPRTSRNEHRRQEVCLLNGSRWLVRWCQPRQLDIKSVDLELDLGPRPDAGNGHIGRRKPKGSLLWWREDPLR